jgi:hypothetical protein
MRVLLLALKLESAVIVGRAEEGAAYRDAPTEARADGDAELAVVLVAREGKKRVYVVDDEVAPLEIGGEKIADGARRGWKDAGKTAVRWSTVEPEPWRDDGEFHSNVVTGGDDHGKWVGYDPIGYFETPVGDWSSDASARRRAASATPSREEDDLYGGLGTMRYKVEVRLDGEGEEGRILATAGADQVDTFGILPSVHRVSIRKDDSYAGWLASYFLVPEVFGSAGPGKNHQTERFTGADCADVLVGALRRQGRKVEYSHVAGLTSYAKVLVDPVELDEDGMPAEGSVIEGVRIGDVIRIDYGGAYANLTKRSWDHVAVLWEDKSDPDGPKAGAADGQLDGFDVVVHMGHPRLVIERLREQAPARIDVLRWKKE